MVKKLIISLLATLLILIALVSVSPWALYLYGLRGLPSDTSPATEFVPPVVLRVLWISETETMNMHMDPMSVWDWVKVFVAARPNTLTPSSKVANLAARVLVSRNPNAESRSAFTRHVQEMAAAIWVSQHWTAEEAMATVLAGSYFGHGFYGLSHAARGYFGLSAQELSVAEAAVVAGLLRSPTRYDPWCRPERSRAFAESLVTKIEPGTILASRLLPAPAGACK